MCGSHVAHMNCDINKAQVYVLHHVSNSESHVFTCKYIDVTNVCFLIVMGIRRPE